MNEGERTFGWFVLIAVAALWVGIAISRYLQIVEVIVGLHEHNERQFEINAMQDAHMRDLIEEALRKP